jgi:SAM-dependent methyltransferase
MNALLPEGPAGWYAEKVREHGFGHRGLGFRNRSSQEKRFEALMQLGDFDGARLLDVGCGFGDFLVYLHQQGIKPVYTGLDICEPMIDRCRQLFGPSTGRFVVGDVLDYEPKEKYDYVVASGLFGLDSQGARERIRPTMERLFHWARIGVAMNFLSTRSPEPVDQRIYIDPAKALEAGFALTESLRIDHTYLPNDFTLYLYKVPAWQDERRGSAS